MIDSLPIWSLFFWLLVGHAVCDYPLQGDFLAKAKNEKAPITGIDWRIALGMHCVMHAGMVALLTGSVLLTAFEYVVHWQTDRAKCRGLTSFRTDQAIHIATKVVIVCAMIPMRRWGVL